MAWHSYREQKTKNYNDVLTAGHLQVLQIKGQAIR